MITYRLGIQQGKVDALSRRSYFAPKLGNPTYDHQEQVLLSPSHLQLMVTNVAETTLDSKFLDSIRSSIGSNDFAQYILDHIVPTFCTRSNFSRMDYGNFSWHDGIFYQNNCTYIPNGPSRLEVLHHCHDSPLAGHFGVLKTLELVT